MYAHACAEPAPFCARDLQSAGPSGPPLPPSSTSPPLEAVCPLEHVPTVVGDTQPLRTLYPTSAHHASAWHPRRKADRSPGRRSPSPCALTNSDPLDAGRYGISVATRALDCAHLTLMRERVEDGACTSSSLRARGDSFEIATGRDYTSSSVVASTTSLESPREIGEDRSCKLACASTEIPACSSRTLDSKSRSSGSPGPLTHKWNSTLTGVTDAAASSGIQVL